jgi:hypothetical protein
MPVGCNKKPETLKCLQMTGDNVAEPSRTAKNKQERMPSQALLPCQTIKQTDSLINFQMEIPVCFNQVRICRQI